VGWTKLQKILRGRPNKLITEDNCRRDLHSNVSTYNTTVMGETTNLLYIMECMFIFKNWLALLLYTIYVGTTLIILILSLLSNKHLLSFVDLLMKILEF
jgi:hypothetical protein